METIKKECIRDILPCGCPECKKRVTISFYNNMSGLCNSKEFATKEDAIEYCDNVLINNNGLISVFVTNSDGNHIYF